MTIFISIASYCDPMLRFTIDRAIDMAKNPHLLHFGVVDQHFSSEATSAINAHDVKPAKLSRIWVNPLQSRGASWARMNAMSLYDGEDWFFQIDSHMDFKRNWDQKLIDWALHLQKDNKNIVISSYPAGFTLDEAGKSVHDAVPLDGVHAHVVAEKFTVGVLDAYIRFEAHVIKSSKALNGFHLGAGCLFAPGSFVEKFPYDPHYYFHGEEQALAARLYTHGWDIYHIPNLPIFHMYTDTPKPGNPHRKMHWDPSISSGRSFSWQKLQATAMRRLYDLLVGGVDLGAYGLGKQRSLSDYAKFCGIHYPSRTLTADSMRGRWDKHKEIA